MFNFTQTGLRKRVLAPSIPSCNSMHFNISRIVYLQTDVTFNHQGKQKAPADEAGALVF
jgi:hypothetical protein